MVANFITAVIYYVILALDNVGTAENYHSIFTTLALGANVLKIPR
jgi:hypothetical protein